MFSACLTGSHRQVFTNVNRQTVKSLTFVNTTKCSENQHQRGQGGSKRSAAMARPSIADASGVVLKWFSFFGSDLRLICIGLVSSTQCAALFLIVHKNTFMYSQFIGI
jgi:hypothetical protein